MRRPSAICRRWARRRGAAATCCPRCGTSQAVASRDLAPRRPRGLVSRCGDAGPTRGHAAADRGPGGRARAFRRCGDPRHRLAQAVLALVLNAVDASPPGGRVELETRAEDGKVLVTVRDEGSGIPDEVRRRLFEPFVSTREPGQGLGLGADGVPGDRRAHGGWIELQAGSRAGKPLRPAVPAGAPRTRGGGSMATPERISVLVLEDDPAFGGVVEEELRSRGHDVTRTSSVAEARERLRDDSFDVALLDLQLPDGSGLDVLREIGAEALPVEALVLTGHAEVPTALEAMRLGAYDYLSKPPRLEELRRPRREGGREGTAAPRERGAARAAAAPRAGGRLRDGGSGDQADARDPRAGRRLDAAGADPGRDRHRQGAARAGPARAQPAQRLPVRAAQLRGAARDPDRERAVRPRARRLHRRDRAARPGSSRSPTAARCSSTRSAS